MTILLWLLAALCILIGFIGVILPALPGTPLMFLGVFLAAWANDFTLIGKTPLIVCGILTALSLVADFAAAALGAKRVGASPMAMLGAALGTLGGIFFGFIGIVIGPFVGAVVGELYSSRSVSHAGRVGVSTWIGILAGTLVKISIAFAMIGILIGALMV